MSTTSRARPISRKPTITASPAAPASLSSASTRTISPSTRRWRSPTGDVVLVPKGYHPVGAPHGFDLWYLNVMAGPVKAWKFTMAPDHAWLTF